MTTYSSEVLDLTSASVDTNPSAAMSPTPQSASRYRNSVWDTQETESDKTHYWFSDGGPDVNGLSYDGPGTWGVDTSGLSAIKVRNEGDATPQTPTESNLWTPPENPHAMDDEFDQSTLDSSWYNYSWPLADFGTISYGTVNAYDTTFNSGDVLRVNVNSDERRSWVLMQAPQNRLMCLGKAYIAPTNVLMVSRCKFNSYYQSQVSGDRHIFLTFMADTAGVPNRNERMNIALNLSSTGIVRGSLFETVSGSDTGHTYTTDVDSKGQALEYIALHKIGTTYHGWVGTASGNWIWMGSITNSTVMKHIGTHMYCVSVDKPAVAVFGVDFIRFYETNNFLL